MNKFITQMANFIFHSIHISKYLSYFGICIRKQITFQTKSFVLLYQIDSPQDHMLSMIEKTHLIKTCKMIVLSDNQKSFTIQSKSMNDYFFLRYLNQAM